MKSKTTKQFDLHLHSYYSDGKDSPRQVLSRAKRAGLLLTALTDHNTLEHLSEARRAGEKLKINVLPAMEISAVFSGKQIHLLALCFDQRNKTLVKLITNLQKRRRKEIFRVTKKLRKLGFIIADEALTKIRPDYWEFSHVINLLLKNAANKKKILREVGDLDVFNIINAYFAKGKAAYVPEKFPSAIGVIKTIKQAGGITILAHPGFHLAFTDDSIIKQLASRGLDALEVFTPKHNWQQITHYEILAKKLKLAITAGSDYHAEIHKAHIPLGSPVGLLRLPNRVFNNFVKFLHSRMGYRSFY